MACFVVMLPNLTSRITSLWVTTPTGHSLLWSSPTELGEVREVERDLRRGRRHRHRTVDTHEQAQWNRNRSLAEPVRGDRHNDWLANHASAGRGSRDG